MGVPLVLVDCATERARSFVILYIYLLESN